MEKWKQPATLWLLAGATLSLCVLILVAWGTHSSPAVLVNDAKVLEAAEQMLECARAGDFQALEDRMQGTPDLGAGPGEADSAQSLLWQAYLSSITYTLPERCHAQNGSIVAEISVSCLDLSAVTTAMETLAPELLAQAVREADSEETIYDGENGYREEFLAGVLREAATQALARERQRVEYTLSLSFAREGGRWQVVPTEELLQFLSGFVSE